MNDPLYTQAPKPKRNMKPFIFIAVLAIAIVAGALILGGGLPFLSASTPNDPSTPQGSGLVVDPNAGDDKYVAPVTNSPGIAIPGFVTLTFPAYTTSIQGVNLHNPEANAGNFYLTYKLCLLDENGEVSEVLYESQLLPPGKYIQNIEIARALAPGEYAAMMQVQPYRIADTTPTNNANLKLTLIVK